MRKNRKKTLLVVGIIFLLGVGVYYVFGRGETKTVDLPVKNTEHKKEDTKETYTTVSPAILDEGQSLTLIGTVISNEFATIYARRSGIIKDLYIDIGDTIEENQTIGELLPPGDVGQSSANIYAKQVQVEEADANLDFMQKVSEQMVEKAELAKDLQEIDGDTASAEMLEKIAVDIASSERELVQLQIKHLEQLSKIQDDLAQEKNQALVLVTSTLQTLEHIMLGGDHSSLTIGTDDLRTGLGVKNTATRRRALDAYRRLKALQEGETYGDIPSLLDTTYGTLDTFLEMIEVSIVRADLSQDMLEEFTQMLLAKQTSLLNMKEMLEDIENLYATTIASQTQAVVMLENMVNKGEAMLGEKTATLQTILEKAEQQVGLVSAEQNLKVQQAKNKLQVARANLGKEYASSGNKKITTPFGGTVSKRMAQVGDVVSMGMPLYELIDVPTSLAKKAKREVQFGLPEEYLHLITLGDSIQFSSAQSDIDMYTGTIHRISPQVDQMTKTITVQATLAEGVNLPHNSRVNIILAMIEQKSYQLPTASIITTDGETFVAVLDKNEEVELVAISVLAEDGEFADVQGELSTDDRIIKNY